MSVFIIAEIGINHNGDVGIAKKLIDVVKNAGADAVKFQKRTINQVYSKRYLDSPRESPWGLMQRGQKEALEFGKEEYDEIDRYCKEKNIVWFASAWDVDSLKFLRQYNLKYNKVASTMMAYPKFLKEVASDGKHTFISTGMSDLAIIDCAVNIFRKMKCPFELMHCVSTYPMFYGDANLQCITTLRDRYQCNVGYSGHEVGLVVSYAAVALGAVSLERHITLNRTMYGSDQAASVEPNGFRSLVQAVRKISTAMGDGQIKIHEKEIPIVSKLRGYDPIETNY